MQTNSHAMVVVRSHSAYSAIPRHAGRRFLPARGEGAWRVEVAPERHVVQNVDRVHDLDPRTTMTDAPRPSLPPGYREVAELAQRPGVRVVHASHGEREVALRLETSGEESLAELAVLATVQHPGLARLVDHGALADGGRFLAREWVVGRQLSELVGDRSPEHLGSLGLLVAELCEALAHLHERGFLHGDLKPANVLVDGDGAPVLTDFGLSRSKTEATPSAAGVAGSLFHLPPEVLLGGPLDERGELFAVGVLLLSLLSDVTVDARSFYGRFPSQPFLSAADVDLASLPEWSRDLLGSLLSRDPARRPVSAAWVGQVLRSRLSGTKRGRVTARPRFQWPVLEGRTEFVDERTGAWAAGGGEPVELWTFLDPSESTRVADAVALRFALSGGAVRGLDLESELSAVHSTRDLDHWLRAREAELEKSLLVVSCAGSSRWAQKALGALARTARGGRDRGAQGALLLTGPPDLGAGAAELGVVPTHVFPTLTEDHVRRQLTIWLVDAEGLALETLAARIHAECGGSAARAEGLLQAVADEGWIRLESRGLRLRSGALPEHLGRTRGPGVDEIANELSPDARLLLAAAAVWRGPVERGLFAQLTGLQPGPLQGALEEVLGRGLLARESGDAARFSLVATRPRRAALGIERQRWSELHSMAAGLVQELGQQPWLRFLHLLSVDPEGQPREEAVTGLREELEDLRTRGCTELALDLSTRIEDEARREAWELPVVLVAELTLTWAVLGEVDLAEERLVASSDPSSDVQALESRTRARIATLRQQHDLALEHLARAAELDPSSAAHALQAEARLHYEARRDDALETLAAEVKAGRRGELPQIVAVNLASLVAMARFRRGEVDEAREGLEASVAEAERLGESSHEAGDRINLGIVLRHTGRLEEAVVQLERALELNDRAGFGPGVTQAQSMLAGVLRDRGELARAESLAVAAADARERVGDAAGAERARALVGLVLAERGHARAAATTLERSAQALVTAGAKSDAAWLTARAGEMRARFSAEVAGGSKTPPKPTGDDPRILLALARMSWLSGDADGAAQLARRASEQAEILVRTAPGEEATLLLSLLRGAGPPSEPGFKTRLVLEDARVLALLADARDPGRLMEALEFAEDLALHGRDDRSARLALAVLARSADDDQRREARRLSEEGLNRCAVGCDGPERLALLEHLLGIPDPQPEDLEALASEEDWDMDVLTLLDINQRLVEQQDLPRLLGSIVENALEVTGAERGFLVLEEDGEFSLDLAMDSRRGDIDEPEVEVSHSVLREVLERGEALRLSNAAEDPILGSAPSVSALELRSVLCQPFAVGDGVRGVIYLDNRLREGAFSERAERLLGLLAGQAALAIRQVRRVERIAELNKELEQEVVTKESDLRTARRALASSGLTVPVDGMVGSSEAMSRVHDLLRRAAPARITVLVTGPSGTGKELAARALHDLAPWKDGPLVSENCAALPASIIESELFGYVKGAFTGADSDRPGLFERSIGGTLFLDEVGELPLELQAKLLRVLETREVRRLGAQDTIPVDFRLIAATNRDLAEEVTAGRFREDLLYRLDGVRIEMPPLADRVEDIPELVDHFMRLQKTKDHIERACSPEIVRRLTERAWSGNVRELANEIARLCVLSEGDLVDPELLREPQHQREERRSGPITTIADLEKQAILDTLERTRGDKRRAAELLGISRAKIYQRLKEWGVSE